MHHNPASPDEEGEREEVEEEEEEAEMGRVRERNGWGRRWKRSKI